MGQIVLSLKKDIEKDLRELSKELYDGRKGALSRVVEDAITLMRRESKRKRAFEELLKEARNAKNLGIGTFKRSELYE